VVSRGDHVVVESSAAEFFEARVLELDGERARVQVLPKNDTKQVELGDLYRIGETNTLASGALAICRTAENAWNGCRVQRANEHSLEITTDSGKSASIPRVDALVPSSVTELNLRRRFERTQQRSEFEAALGGARAPRPPPGYRPDAGARVLVRLDGGWFAAKVFEIDREDLRVRWVGSGRISDVDRKDVIPMPPYSNSFRRGDFALGRPLEPARAWLPVRVEKVTGAEIRVKDVDGSERSLTSADLVPLG
jgi:hypothetical protein